MLLIESIYEGNIDGQSVISSYKYLKTRNREKLPREYLEYIYTTLEEL